MKSKYLQVKLNHIQFGELKNSSLRELKLIECTGDDVSFNNFYVQKSQTKVIKLIKVMQWQWVNLDVSK